MNLVSSCMGDHSELIFAFWFSEDFNIQRYSEGFVFWLFWFVVPFWCLVSISLWLLDWWVDAWGLRADHRSVHLSTGNFRSTMQHLPQRKTPSAQRMFRWEGLRRISSNSICMQPWEREHIKAAWPVLLSWGVRDKRELWIHWQLAQTMPNEWQQRGHQLALY